MCHSGQCCGGLLYWWHWELSIPPWEPVTPGRVLARNAGQRFTHPEQKESEDWSLCLWTRWRLLTFSFLSWRGWRGLWMAPCAPWLLPLLPGSGVNHWCQEQGSVTIVIVLGEVKLALIPFIHEGDSDAIFNPLLSFHLGQDLTISAFSSCVIFWFLLLFCATNFCTCKFLKALAFVYLDNNVQICDKSLLSVLPLFSAVEDKGHQFVKIQEMS